MRHRVVFVAGFIAICGVSFLLRGAVADAVIRFELARAIDDANRAHSRDPQLAREHDLIGGVAALFPISTPAQHVRRLLELTKNRRSDEAWHGEGVALLLDNQPALAIESMSAIATARRSGSVWTNLAAAELRAAEPERDHDRLLAALAAVDEALALHPASTEAAYDRTLILRAIGLVFGDDDATAWKRGTARLDRLSDQHLRQLTNRYPQQARTYAESVYLCAWGDAVKRRSILAADAELHRLTVIADALRSRGEGFLFDVVSAIDNARRSHDWVRIRATAAALDLYRKGRQSTKEHAAVSAADSMVTARNAFIAAGSPMVAMTDCYIAINLIDSNRAPDAKHILRKLISAQRASPTPHPALLAFALYHSALIEARDGNWSDSLAAANESRELFQRLGERGLAGTVEGLLSQDYEFLGQPQWAWQHGIVGIERSLRAGDSIRARATLAALSRAELRHGRWRFARALIGAEQLVASHVDDLPQMCDMLIRIATAESHIGLGTAANRDVSAARRGAERVSDPALRAKLLADVDGAAGSLLRVHPDRALPLLNSAITFEQRAGRTIVLPALYLERGRAESALHHEVDARNDFEAGIAVLERQRGRTVASELRPGIFDDATDLFDEAISHALRRGAPGVAFRYIERGRARAILEEIAFGDAGRPEHELPVIEIGEVMKALGPDDLLLEYARLDDGMVLFALDRTSCTFTIVGQSRASLQRDTDSMIEAFVSRRPSAEFEQVSSRAYGALIGHIRDRVASKRNLIIVGDASLQQMPFAALYDPATRHFLVQDHAIVTVPSAAIYVLSAHRHVAASALPQTVAIFANPLPHAAPFDSLNPLTASESEGRIVAHHYPTAFVALRSDATAARFMAEAPRFDIVHFAGHAVTRPLEPWHSALLFASSGHDDGTLSVEQVTHMSFVRTRLVILAACSTLRAQKSGVEGVPSLARAFLVAGVPSVVGTLSDVDDFEATTLLTLLHDGIRRGLAPADALRAAQLAVLRGDDPALRQPGYWAAFALLGGGLRQ
jgi:CHAT domain-containing protein